MSNTWGGWNAGDPQPHQQQPGGSYPPQTLYPPGAYTYPAPGSFPPAYPQRPSVITWFTAYCVFMALLYGLVFGGSAFVLASPELFEHSPRHDPTELRIQAIAMAIIGLPLMVLFAIAPMLPRRPWVWIYDIILICLGLTSCCLWPGTIPLLIFWIKPEARAWFGRAV